MAANQGKYLEKLNKSQIKRFRNAFDKVFDLNGNGTLGKESCHILVEKWRAHSDIKRDHEMYEKMEKQLNGSFDMIKKAAEVNGIVKAGEGIDLEAFFNVHAYIFSEFKKLEDCPEPVKEIPSLWFKIIGNNDEEVLSREEYKRFYKDFCSIPEQELDAYTDQAYDAMTKGGTVKLDEKRFAEIVDDFFFNPSDQAVGNYFIGFLD